MMEATMSQLPNKLSVGGLTPEQLLGLEAEVRAASELTQRCGGMTPCMLGAMKRRNVREQPGFPFGLDNPEKTDEFLMLVMKERDEARAELRFYEAAFTDFQRMIRARRKAVPDARRKRA